MHGSRYAQLHRPILQLLTAGTAIMSPNIIAFRRCTEEEPFRVPPSAAPHCQLTRPPSPLGGLTAHDTLTLRKVVFALKGDCRCRVTRDGRGALWAAISAQREDLAERSAFLICRVDGQLWLIDVTTETHWTTLGRYNSPDGLATDLGAIIGWQSVQ